MSVTNETPVRTAERRGRTRHHQMEVRREGINPDGDWLYVWACVHCGQTLAQLDSEAAPNDPTRPASRACPAA